MEVGQFFFFFCFVIIWLWENEKCWVGTIYQLLIGWRLIWMQSLVRKGQSLKLQSVTFFVFKMYKYHIMSDYILNPFSKQSYPESLQYTYNKCLYMTILDWFGLYHYRVAQYLLYMTRHRHKQREITPATMFFHKMHAVLFINQKLRTAALNGLKDWRSPA